MEIIWVLSFSDWTAITFTKAIKTTLQFHINASLTVNVLVGWDKYYEHNSLLESLLTKRFSHRYLQKSVVNKAIRDVGEVGEETRAALKSSETKWRRTSKSVCKTAPKYRSILSAGTVSTVSKVYKAATSFSVLDMSKSL